MHRRLSMFASLDLTRVLLGPAWSLPSLPVDAPTGGACYSSQTLDRRRLFYRCETLATASRTRARNGLVMHLAHRCRTRRNTDNFTFSHAPWSNRSDINGLRGAEKSYNVNYVNFSRETREIPPPARPTMGVVLVQDHTHPRLKFCPPGTPYRTLTATEKNYGWKTQA